MHNNLTRTVTYRVLGGEGGGGEEEEEEKGGKEKKGKKKNAQYRADIPGQN